MQTTDAKLCDGAPARAQRTNAMDAFRAEAVVKDFGRNRVLKGVDLTLRPGEITAFMGANGAGKSTLVKIIAGVHGATSGAMTLAGESYAPRSPSDALRKGVVVVHQAINDNVILSTDVLENLLIDRLCQGTDVFFNRRRLKPEAKAMLERVGLDVPLDREMAALSLADRQLVTIARALAHDPRLLILDEPTSALSDTEAERLFAVLADLRERGVPILYISHRMGDIRRLADRILVLRDGVLTADLVPPLDYEAAVSAMLGAVLAKARHERVAAAVSVVELSGLKVAADDPPINLSLHADEVTAIVGLVGAGKTELGETLYGLRQPAAGTMTLGGTDFAPRSVREALAAGVFMAAEDRASGSLVGDFDLSRNLTLPFTEAFSAFGMMRRSAERAQARNDIARLGIVARGPDDPIGTLSGGNQQKVVLARWLSKPSKLLILDEPFQGVDIAARRDLGDALRQTAKGRATLVLCSDLDEAIEVADRILVMSHGAITGEHSCDALDRDAIVRDMSAFPALGKAVPSAATAPAAV